jgi:sterol desaturase/sphingolipid hydroxylase (fatty acid hydroxylase superfamily)
VVVATTLLIRGFVSFGTHWLNHKVPFLWRFHRVHHLDTELDVSSTVRFHPLEMPISLLLGLPVVVGFGLSPWVLIFYELLDVSVTLFSHSNIRVPPWLDRPLRYVIVTPNLHTVHHSTHRPETDSNFSAVFPIWDVIMGTFRTETRQPLESMPLGLDDVRDARAHRFWWLLASPFRAMT